MQIRVNSSVKQRKDYINIKKKDYINEQKAHGIFFSKKKKHMGTSQEMGFGTSITFTVNLNDLPRLTSIIN